MRVFRSLGMVAVTAALAATIGCSAEDWTGKPVTDRILTTAEKNHLTELANPASATADPGLVALVARNYETPNFNKNKDQPRLYMLPCGTASQETCLSAVEPTVEVPMVVVRLNSEPAQDGVMAFAGTFYLVYPNAETGNPDNQLQCTPQAAPTGVPVGPSGLWAALPDSFKEIGEYFTAQTYNEGKPVQTKAMSDGTTWSCSVHRGYV